MTEREYLYTVATTLLLIALLRHTRFYQHTGAGAGVEAGAGEERNRLGRVDLGMMMLGSLIPLLDPAIAYFTTADRIAFLTHTPRLAGLYYGLSPLAFLTGVLCFLMPFSKALRYGLLGAAGLLLYQLLLVLTPLGAPLLAPFSLYRVSLPVLPTNHILLLFVLGIGVLLLELLPSIRRQILPATLALASLIVLVSAGTTVYMMVQTAPLKEKEFVVSLYPDNIWLSRWVVIAESEHNFEVRRYRLWEPLPDNGDKLERWNDQAVLLRLMGDPVVHRFYHRMFRHPVARVETTGAQITLFLNEVDDLSSQVPGRTFYVESNQDGGNRFYQLQRFY